MSHASQFRFINGRVTFGPDSTEHIRKNPHTIISLGTSEVLTVIESPLQIIERVIPARPGNVQHESFLLSGMHGIAAPRVVGIDSCPDFRGRAE